MIDGQRFVETFAVQRVAGVHQELVLLHRLSVRWIGPQVHEAGLPRNLLPLRVVLGAVPLAGSESTETPS